MLQKLSLWTQKHERHLSAFAMVAGFIADNLLFARVDLLQTQLVFATYTIICFLTIPTLHWLKTHNSENRIKSALGTILPFITQFALGGFWSGLIIFYERSADLGSSWPFLLFLLLVLIANEYFRQYHDRLVFTSVLFFFALYSYTIFAVPIVTGTIGTRTFLESGAVAISVFAIFTILLRNLARERFLTDLWRIRAGAFFVLVLMNVFYFTNILPPLPLSVEAAGIYHSVWRIPGAYLAVSEKELWEVRFFGLAPTLHVVSGESLSAYSSVFAPTTLTTTIVHRWEWYDNTKKEWVVKATVSYPIAGGRDGGYRGYSTVLVSDLGQWRVAIETIDGRRITRLPFTVEAVEVPPIETTIILK
jgi:hypothetical protein